MLLNQRKVVLGTFALSSVFFLAISVTGQNSVSSGRPIASVTTLDSNKEQDGLVGSVRRVQTESSRLQVKSGKVIEGRRQLLEITTYNLKGARVDNVSYPVAGAAAGKEEYKYDDKGNIVEMTLRGADGSIISRETYTYEFDKIGNWVKMVSSLVVFEGGELKNEPVEVTYRTIAYYFDDAIAKLVDAPPVPRQSTPGPAPAQLRNSEVGNGGELNRSETPPNVEKSKPEQPVNSKQTPGAKPPVALRVDRGVVVLTGQPKPIEAPARDDISRPNSSSASSAPPKPIEAPARKDLARPDSSPASSAPPPAVAEESTSKPAEIKTSLSLYDVGINHFQEGNFKEAVKAFENYLKLEPESARAHLDLGFTYLKLDKRGDAIKAFKKAISKNPQLEEAHYLLGVEYLKTRSFHDSVVAFKKTLQLRPDMAQAHYGLALAYQELGRTDQVIQEYRTLQRLDSSLAKKLAETFPDLSRLPCRTGPFCR